MEICIESAKSKTNQRLADQARLILKKVSFSDLETITESHDS